MTRPKHSPPPCAVCDHPRVWDEHRGVYVCRKCQPHRAHQRDHVTTYEGVEVDST